MSAAQYKLVFRGEALPGQNIDEVKRKVASLYKITIEKCEEMFSGKSIIVKDGLTYEAAEHYKKMFEKTGGLCTIEQVAKNQNASQQLQQPAPEKNSHSVNPPPNESSSNIPINKVDSIGGNALNPTPQKTRPQKVHQVDDSVVREIPLRIKELIHESEKILYASRPSKNALTISMIVNGIVYGIIGLSIYLVGVVVVLPVALLVTYYSWKNKYYIVTDSRTIVAQGIFNVATKIIKNKNIQIISINTGVIDRWLKLNSIELSTAGQGGGGTGVMSAFPMLSKGSVTLKQVVVKDVIKHYAEIAH